MEEIEREKSIILDAQRDFIVKRNKAETRASHARHWNSFVLFCKKICKKDPSECEDYLFPDLPDTICLFMTRTAMTTEKMSSSTTVKCRAALSDYYKVRLGLRTWHVSDGVGHGNPMTEPSIAVLCQSIEKAKKRTYQSKQAIPITLPMLELLFDFMDFEKSFAKPHVVLWIKGNTGITVFYELINFCRSTVPCIFLHCSY